MSLTISVPSGTHSAALESAAELAPPATLDELDQTIAAMKARGEPELGLVLLRRTRHARPDQTRELITREYQLALACQHIEYALNLRSSAEWLSHCSANRQLLAAAQLRLAANQLTRNEERFAKLIDENAATFAVELSNLRWKHEEQYSAAALLTRRVLQRRPRPSGIRRLALQLALQDTDPVNLSDPVPALTRLFNSLGLGQTIRLFRNEFMQNQALFRRFVQAWLERDKTTTDALSARGRLALLHIAYAVLPAAGYRQLAMRLAHDHPVKPQHPSQPATAVAHLAHAVQVAPSVLHRRRDRPLRIALCLSGQMRGFEQAAPTLRHLGLEPHEVSVFVHTWRDVGWRFPNPVTGNGVSRLFLHRPFVKAYLRAGFLYGTALMREAYPRFFGSLAVECEVDEAALRAAYGAGAVIRIEDHLAPEFDGDTTNQRKMFTKIARCHQLALSQDKAFDLMIRLRPDKSFLPPAEVIDWHAMAERSSGERTLFMAPVKITETLYADDQFAIGAPAVMDVYARALETQQQAQSQTWIGFPHRLQAHGTLAHTLLYGGVTVTPTESLRIGPLVAERTYDQTTLRTLLMQDIATRTPTPMDQLLLSALD